MKIVVRKSRKKQSSKKPTEGIWYLVYYNPEWRLEVFKHDDFPNLGHVDAWNQYILPDFEKHYSISLNEEIPWGFPRGRICHIPQDMDMVLDGEKPGHWYAYHGNDCPEELNQNRLERWIISQFNLNGPAARGLVHFEYSSHETMDETDKKEIQKIINYKKY